MIQELDRLNIDAYHEIVECITSALDARDYERASGDWSRDFE